MQFQQIMYFVTVAEQGSFNKAAEKLFTSQPNLSKTISNLESELKVRIFERTNKGVVLTDDGKKLYHYARTILNQMELIEGLASKEVPRTLSIASYPIITMGQLVSEFYNAHQGEDIFITLTEKRMSQVMDMVENGDAEIGFIMYNQAQGKEVRNMLNFKGLEFHMLGNDTWYLNVGPNHPLYDREEVTAQELTCYPFVRMPDDYYAKLTHYLEVGGVRLTEFKRKIYVSDSYAILRLLHETDAIRWGPGVSKSAFLDHDIRTIPIKNCGVQITAGWISRKRDILSEEALSFVALLEKMYPIEL